MKSEHSVGLNDSTKDIQRHIHRCSLVLFIHMCSILLSCSPILQVDIYYPFPKYIFNVQLFQRTYSLGYILSKTTLKLFMKYIYIGMLFIKHKNQTWVTSKLFQVCTSKVLWVEPLISWKSKEKSNSIQHRTLTNRLQTSNGGRDCPWQLDMFKVCM